MLDTLIACASRRATGRITACCAFAQPACRWRGGSGRWAGEGGGEGWLGGRAGAPWPHRDARGRVTVAREQREDVVLAIVSATRNEREVGRVGAAVGVTSGLLVRVRRGEGVEEPAWSREHLALVVRPVLHLPAQCGWLSAAGQGCLVCGLRLDSDSFQRCLLSCNSTAHLGVSR
jgi:hypothetical protein